MNIYVSSYDKEKTITICDLGKNGIIGISKQLKNPSFPSYLKKYKDYLYVALKKENENSISGILEYKIEKDSLKNQKLYKSNYSFTHLYINSKYIIGASYHQGLIQIFEKNSNFSTVKKYLNSKIHNVGYIDRIDKFYAVDLENNCIYFFRYINRKIQDEQVVKLDENDSPRHIWYQSKSRYIYLVNENSSSISVLDIDDNFKIIQKISTLISSTTDENMASAIMGDSKNNLLYVSNRGADNIVVYKINPRTGILEYCFCINDICSTPRDFYIKQDLLYIANQTDNTLVSVKVDSKNKNYNILQKIQINTPVCVEI